MKAAQTIDKIRLFLKDEGSCSDIEFMGMYDGLSVYLVSDPDTDEAVPTGLPIFVLSTGITHRFATSDETMDLMNGSFVDIPGMITGQDIKQSTDSGSNAFVHIVKEDLSSKDGTFRALEAIRELYRKRRHDYARNVDGLLEHDAYILLLNTGESMSPEVDDLLFYIDEVARLVSDGFIVFPYFMYKFYREEVLIDLKENPGAVPEDSSILVYDDEIQFETLLSLVNRSDLISMVT